MFCVKGLAYGGNGIFMEFGKWRKVEEVIRVQRSTRIVTVGVSINICRRVGMLDHGGTRVSMRTYVAASALQLWQIVTQIQLFGKPESCVNFFPNPSFDHYSSHLPSQCLERKPPSDYQKASAALSAVRSSAWQPMCFSTWTNPGACVTMNLWLKRWVL